MISVAKKAFVELMVQFLQSSKEEQKLRHKTWLCHGSSSQSPASDCRCLQWDLLWTKWHCDRFLSSLDFPVNIIPPWPSILIIIWGMNNRPTGGYISVTESRPINMNNKNEAQTYALTSGLDKSKYSKTSLIRYRLIQNTV
jgi:hypothetical protein